MTGKRRSGLSNHRRAYKYSLNTQSTPITYTITYNGNTNTSGNPPTFFSYTTGSIITVLGNTGSLAKTGYTFSG